MTCSCRLPEMVERYGPMVRSIVAARVGWHEEFEDVVHDVWVKAVERSPSLRDPERAAAWLARIACTTALDRIRRTASRERRFRLNAADPAPWLTGGAADDGCGWEREETLEKVHAAIRRLPARERRALHLLYFEGQSCSRITRDEGRSRTAIRWRLAQARALLRAALAKVAGESWGQAGSRERCGCRTGPARRRSCPRRRHGS